MRISTLAPGLALVAACALPSEEVSQLLPDNRLVIEANTLGSQARQVGERSSYAETLSDLIGQTNDGLGELLELIDTVTELPPSYVDDDEVLWGPWLADGMYGQLVVETLADDSHTWAIQFREEGSAEDAWADALRGEIETGSSESASSGHFTMDFSMADTLGAGETLQGQVQVTYQITEGGAEAEVVFEGVSQDGIMPADGTVWFSHQRDTGGVLDALLSRQVSGTDTDAEELVDMRARWDGDGAGRSDAYLSGGDFGESQHTETECWSVAHTVTYYENSFEPASNGNVEDCAFVEPDFPERLD